MSVTQEQHQEVLSMIRDLSVQNERLVGRLDVTNTKLEALTQQLLNDAKARRFTLTITIAAITAVSTAISIVALLLKL